MRVMLLLFFSFCFKILILFSFLLFFSSNVDSAKSKLTKELIEDFFLGWKNLESFFFSNLKRKNCLVDEEWIQELLSGIRVELYFTFFGDLVLEGFYNRWALLFLTSRIWNEFIDYLSLAKTGSLLFGKSHTSHRTKFSVNQCSFDFSVRAQSLNQPKTNKIFLLSKGEFKNKFGLKSAPWERKQNLESWLRIETFLVINSAYLANLQTPTFLAGLLLLERLIELRTNMETRWNNLWVKTTILPMISNQPEVNSNQTTNFYWQFQS